MPLLIIPFPLLGTLLSTQLDLVDYYLLPVNFSTYQIVDKLLDTYYLSIAFYVSLFWKDKVAKKASIISFIYRLFGVILFFILNKDFLLFIFPNFFENFFLFYSAFKAITKRQILFDSRKTFVLIILVCLIPKLFQEYIMHVSKIPVTDLIHIYLGATTNEKLG
ncbi:hypothetical protein KW795_02910 [Candidatus Microgenomates bacterium]|nr:hypothetical protein [Candidatus Microgenomates bacterium]